MDTKILTPVTSGLSGSIAIPGDKSISHRAIMFGAIASGKTTVKNFLTGNDCLSTVSCFKNLGVDIDVNGTTVEIAGKGIDGLTEFNGTLDVGNSGTTIRLMMGLLAGRAFPSKFTGDSSIAKRPMSRVTDPLKEMGCKIDGNDNGKYVPITVQGGGLKGITYTLPVASAQVKSALLLAGLQAEGETVITEPAPTRDHTERMIRQFGGTVNVSDNKIRINGGQQLKAADITVPGDISSAAFFLVAGAIVPNSRIVLKNIGLNWTRTGIIEVLEEMGASIKISQSDREANEPAGDIVVETSSLRAATIGGSLIPRLIDEIPIIALLATQAEGETVISDARELRVKETDRIETVASELRKLGAKIETTEDGMIIKGGTRLRGGRVSSHGDHRIGMMLSIASLICENEVIVEDADSIAVSYPDFFKDLDSLK
ncbi:3-phosphoshikimate 1-carboxyvinyltransferase [Bacillus sp. FJAT-18017]|uniref:3-phosphoshikimate 1-carboxyvinyltransferase n=1 Tax=Bacillus sp. FJAT-18017 TaxID=1705566 RepID=UPI0006ADBD92|nr:3-phosphoshikimate 1-carboxyvinyltransferase [Bacillus sp. FJAT-18017]ALC90121.1 3-phosphoshikimate 1-carboxyvinyltransferase [Bacillus sp. FJAT-18017]